MNTRVFVYGTLRRGEGNHRLLAGARFVGAARTTPSFTFLDLGAYPAMLEGGATSVVGEIYEVDELTLDVLDHFEGHPRFYRREQIALDDGAEVEAYVLPAERAWGRSQTIESGDWRKRASARKRGAA